MAPRAHGAAAYEPRWRAIASAAGGRTAASQEIERVSLSRPAPHHLIRIAGTSRYRTAPGRSSGSGGWQNPLLAANDRQNPRRGLLDFSQCILNWQKLWAMLDRDRFRGCFCARVRFGLWGTNHTAPRPVRCSPRQPGSVPGTVPWSRYRGFCNRLQKTGGDRFPLGSTRSSTMVPVFHGPIPTALLGRGSRRSRLIPLLNPAPAWPRTQLRYRDAGDRSRSLHDDGFGRSVALLLRRLGRRGASPDKRGYRRED